MESFFLSETLKYLYLLFDIDNVVNSMDSNAVFSTEGHLLPLPFKYTSKKNVELISNNRVCAKPLSFNAFKSDFHWPLDLVWEERCKTFVGILESNDESNKEHLISKNFYAISVMYDIFNFLTRLFFFIRISIYFLYRN